MEDTKHDEFSGKTASGYKVAAFQVVVAGKGAGRRMIRW